MKKLLTVVLLSSTMLLSATEENNYEVINAFAVLKYENITGVTQVERKGDNWFVRYGNDNTTLIPVNTGSHTSTLTYMPRHKVAVEDLIRRSLKEEKGTVAKVEYVDRKVVIKITDGPDDLFFTYDSNGNLVGRDIF